MSQTSEITLTASLMDELTAILATPDPEPAESWAYKIGNLPFGMVMGQLKSIGQIHDLLVTLPDGCFLIVLKENSPDVFTQAFRTGNSFQTECSVPNAWGNLIHRYRLPGGATSPLRCHSR